MKLTTKQFAQQHNVEYGVATGFLHFLLNKGLITVAGLQPPTNGKGKSSTIYEIPDEITVKTTNIQAAA